MPIDIVQENGPGTSTRRMVPISGASFKQPGTESFFCQFRACSILLPVLVSTVSSDWSLLLRLFFVYLLVVNSLQILCYFLNYLTISVISLPVISCSNKTSSSDRICFSLFSSAMFISLSRNFSARKLASKRCTSFMVIFLVLYYYFPGCLSLAQQSMNGVPYRYEITISP